ncbi:Thymidine kinase 2, mitochondrial [Bulinus truncatus]|nr:Thymidine kinase 2, mitochondrial [Bulinus truncatus]
MSIMSSSNIQAIQDLQAHVFDKSKNDIIIAVEGNIGCGKTTLLQHFENMSFCEIIPEPLDKWTNVNGYNALGMLYQNPHRWSFAFNMYALWTRVEMHSKPHHPTRPVKMLERSLYSTRYCFVQNDLSSKIMNSFEFGAFDEWFNFVVKTGHAHVDLIVYLRASPENCFDRLRKRSRKEEADVPLDFIKSLHKLYDDWLLRKVSPVPAPVLLLDADNDLDTMKTIFNSRQQEILCGYG